MAQTLHQSPAAVSCDLGSGAAILNTKSNQYFTLNATGMKIWRMLPASTADIIERFVTDFSVDRERVEEDVNHVISQLLDYQLVRLDKA